MKILIAEDDATSSVDISIHPAVSWRWRCGYMFREKFRVGNPNISRAVLRAKLKCSPVSSTSTPWNGIR